MYKLIILLMIINTGFVLGQNVVEVNRPELSKEFNETVQRAIQYKDSSIYRKIENLENGLVRFKSNYEKYRIIVNTLGRFYTSTKQYDKAIDMWTSANKEGIFFPYNLQDEDFPYLKEYANNKRFLEFIQVNDSIKNVTNSNSRAEYFVNLPINYDCKVRYPLIIILHGGTGNNYEVFKNWESKMLKDSFISVYPRGKVFLGSYENSFGPTGLDDIKEIYQQVHNKYSVDTSKIILAGQSLGGHLSIRLLYNSIKAKGLLLAFPVKPQDLDFQKAISFKAKGLKIVMICGQRDASFFPGQLEMSSILDSAKVEYKFIKYPSLGHSFPLDFSEQIDKGLLYLLDEK